MCNKEGIFLTKVKDKLTNCIAETLDSNYKRAGVLIPIQYSGGNFNFIFIKRKSELTNHAGEVSFPGGALEEFDKDVYDAALRETYEEIGVKKENIIFLGKLDEEITVSKYLVTPFVGFVTSDYYINEKSSYEVDSIFTVPVKYFYNKDIFWEDVWVRDNVKLNVYFYKYNGLIIWGLTGRIITKLLVKIKDIFDINE